MTTDGGSGKGPAGVGEAPGAEQPPGAKESAGQPRDRGRRAFVRNTAALGAGLTGVGAVGVLLHQRDADDAATPRTATPRVVDTRAPEAPEAPDLAIVRGSDAAAATRRAVEALGGMGRFVRSGEKVLVKPNIAWDRLPAHGANTNPTVVAEVVRMCVAAGAAKVVVTDVSCNEARRSFERSGIWRAAQDAGAQVVLPDPSVYEEFDLRGVLGRWRIPRQVVEADRLINVPVVKHHGLSRLTAGMKNWYGVLLDDRRHRLHQVIDEGIVDLAATFRPALTVLDAMLVMVRNGPQGGSMSDVERRDLVAATTDPVAGDAWAASLLGREPEEVPYIGLAERAGLGRSRPPATRRIEITM